MSSLHMDEKFDGTFRQLFDTIERCTEQGSTDRLQTLLEELGGQLALGLDAFGEPSNTARSKIVPEKPISLGSNNTFILTTDEKDVVCHLSDVLQFNELHCAILWNAQKKHNPSILSDFILQRKNQKQDPLQHVEGYSQVFQLFTQAYFEDRLSLLQSLSSLLRLSQHYDDDKPCTHVSIALDAINSLMNGNGDNTIDGQLMKQFSRLARTCIPATFTSSPQLTQVYTYQILKEERALLETLIIYYISRPCPASRLLSIYQEFEANGFGTEQSFGHHLNAVGRSMCLEVTYLCGLLSAQLVQHASANLACTGGIDGEGLQSLSEVIISLNRVMSFLGDIRVHSLPLLAWASFLRCLEFLVSKDGSYGKIKNMLDGTLQSDTSLLLSSKNRPRSIHHGRPSASIATSNRTPIIEQGPELIKRYISAAVKLDAPEYIHNLMSSSQICTDEDTNKLAYHMILYELLSRFCGMLNLRNMSVNTHETVIQSFCLLFQDEHELCELFWNTAGKDSTYMDMDSDTNPAMLLDPKGNAYPRKFIDVIRLLTSVCGDPSLSTDNPPVQNVNRYLMAGGWRNVVDILICFLQGDENAANVSDVYVVLRLFEKVLLTSDSTMIKHLMDHMEEINSFGTGPFIVSLFCEIITFSSTVRNCSVEVLTSAIKCLTALLPYYPVDLWTFVGTSSLFPRPLESDPLLSLDFSKVPTRALGNRHPAQIDHIIASVECEIGKYSILLALLDFIGGLVKDVKQQWWSSQNKEANNEQYKAEILSGYLHYLTSHVLPYYSGWRYKSVYDRYLIGSKMTALFIDIDRFFKFNDKGSDTISYDDKGKVVPTMANVRAVMHYRFLKDEYAIRFYLSPLLDVMSNGAWMAEGLARSGRVKEAQQAETLVKLTFIFVKSLLLQQLTNNNIEKSEAGLLEKAMLNHRSSNSNKMDFLFRLAQLIRYGKHHSGEHSSGNTLPAIPILATNIISLLCLSVSRWKVVPNFVQYLGDTDQVQSIIKSYLAIAKDPSHSESLLTSIWQMLSLLVETQPSLALLFMECGDAIMPSPKTAVKLLDQQNNNSKKTAASVTFSLSSDSASGAASSGSTSNESAVRAAVELLNDWQSLSLTKPTVLSNVLRFLTAFWQSAFDHYAMVQRTRSDNALWLALEAILLNPSNMDSLSGECNDVQRQQQQKNQQLLNDVELDDSNVENVLYAIDNVINDTNQSVRRKCCMDLNRAFIMRLISFEIQLTAGSQVAQGIKLTSGAAVVGDKLPAGLKNILFKMGEPRKLDWMRQCFIKDCFDPSLTHQLREYANSVLACGGSLPLETDNISSLLQLVPKVGFGDDLNNTTGQTRQYGASYIYDLPLAVSRCASLYRKATESEREYLRNQQNENSTTEIMVTPEVRTVRMVKQTCIHFISDVCSFNYNWSLVDAQIMLLQSFKTLMETSSGHASEVIWHTKNKSTMYTFINDLVDKVIEDIKEPTTYQQHELDHQQREYKYNPQEQQNSIALTRHQCIINLIRALTEDWISSNRALIVDKSASQQQLKWDYIKEAISLVKKFCQLLQRENGTLVSGVDNSQSDVRQRPLLESILLCIRTMHTSGRSGEASMQKDHGGLKDDLTQLLHVVCKSFSGAVQSAMALQRRQKETTTALPDAKSEECIKDVTVLLALLGELVKSNEQGTSIPVDVWLPVFEENCTITMLLKVVYHGMILVVDEMESQTKLDNSGLHNIMVSPYAENAMYFMVALSNIPKAALALRNAGVMDLLCNNALSCQLEQGNLDVFVRFGGRSSSVDTSTTLKTAETRTANASDAWDNSHGKNSDSRTSEVGAGGSGFVERHPLHVLWCQMLNVLSNLIRIVGTTDDGLLRLGVLFIQKYSKQVDHSFAIANGANDSLLGLVPSESLSSPLMTEIELLTTILFCLAKQLTRVSPYAVNIFMAFKDCGLSLVKRYLYHFTHPNHMQAQLFPADQDEKLQSQISINNTEPMALSGTSQLTQQQQQMPMVSSGEQYTSQLMYSTTQRAVRIARNILGSIVLLTEAETILTQKDSTWPFGNTILSPDTRTSSSSTVSFGAMKEWTMACLQLLLRTSVWVNESKRQQNDTVASTSQPTIMDLQALLCTLEFSIVLLTTQTILWIAKPDLHQDERKMIANDNLKSLVNLMDKIYTSLNKLELDMQQQAVQTTTIKNEIRALESQIIDPLKHLLITRFFESA